MVSSTQKSYDGKANEYPLANVTRKDGKSPGFMGKSTINGNFQ
jgi:hypothetical protein